MTLMQSFQMEGIVIPLYLVIAGHSYLKYDGAAWNGNHSLQYDMYTIQDVYDLNDTVAFVYSVSAPLLEQSDMEEGDRDSVNGSDDVNMNHREQVEAEPWPIPPAEVLSF